MEEIEMDYLKTEQERKTIEIEDSMSALIQLTKERHEVAVVIDQKTTDHRNALFELEGQVAKIKADMAKATKGELDILDGLDNGIANLREKLELDWHQVMDTHGRSHEYLGWKFNLKQYKTPDIMNERLLMKYFMENAAGEMPFQAKWDNKKLVAIAETGLVEKTLLKTKLTYGLAVTPPKVQK